MEYNRDVDVGEQDINRPSWHLTKKSPCLLKKTPFSKHVVGKILMQIVCSTSSESLYSTEVSERLISIQCLINF